MKLLRKTYERMITWFSARFLTPPSESRTKNTIDKPFPINLDSSETCCFPHPFSSAGGSSPLAIFAAQLPTMPLPQVEELSSSGGDTGSFVTIDDVGSVDTIDLRHSSIPVVDPYVVSPWQGSPLSPPGTPSEIYTPTPSSDSYSPIIPPRIPPTPFPARAVVPDCPRLVPFVPPDLPRYSRSINM